MSGNNKPNHLLIWLQLAGGTFPTGSFNHSYGLETYIQSNRVRNAEDAEEILLTYLEVCIQTDAIFVKEAYEAIRKADTEYIETLQDIYSASKPAKEPYLASVKTGRSLLLGIQNLYAEEAQDLFCRLKDATLSYHYAVAYGMTASMLEMPLSETLQTYIYSGLASLLSVMARIMPLGQNESQLVLFRLSRRLSKLNMDGEMLSLEHVNTFAPGLEIASMVHETIYTRLCMS